MKTAKVAVVGGGVAGATAALYLERLGLDVTLFEKNDSLVSGPPFCHLHAGGNLYREISDAQCITLLRQSIDLLRCYPYAVDFRPTVIAVPLNDDGQPEALYPRLERLRDEYAAMIKEDMGNKVLGEPGDYFQSFEKPDLERLAALTPVAMPRTPEEWMIPVAKELDLSTVKFPLIMVQEYGLNLFRLGAGVALALQKMDNTALRLNTSVIETTATPENDGYFVRFEDAEGSHRDRFDYLINAAGFRSGEIDDMLGFHRERMVEFKAAYVTKWRDDTVWPEIVFHGERGTPEGMAQFTPYPGGYFQLHGMTHDITLFDGGLVGTLPGTAQPRLSPRFIDMIDRSWEWSCVEKRSRRAIEHMARFLPAFAQAEVAAKPLYGAQQIPGDDPTLRAADVTFEGERYARCEVVKASSVLSMIDAIVARLITMGYLPSSAQGCREITRLTPEEAALIRQAEAICENRHYPSPLAGRVVSPESISG